MDWVKECMEIRVECRIPVGRPRRTWIESVEADMANMEIDRENGGGSPTLSKNGIY